MTRKHAIQWAKIAGYHEDSRMFTRLVIESRVNRQTMLEAWADGVQAKNAGVKCTCQECSKQTEDICV